MDEVQHQVLSERNRKIAERVKREKRREYHRRILNVNLPLEVLSETDEEIPRPTTTLSDRSGSVTSHGRTLSRTTSKKSVLSLPKIPKSVSSHPTQPLEVLRLCFTFNFILISSVKKLLRVVLQFAGHISAILRKFSGNFKQLMKLLYYIFFKLIPFVI